MSPTGTTRAGFVESVTVRRIAPMDGAGLERFYAELSDDSRAMRFLGATRPLDSAHSLAFCSIDHEHREGFVAVIDDPDLGAERVVGHLCIEPDACGSAEIAVAVADSWQGLGIGRRLVEAGVVWARGVGVSRLVATAFISNARIVRLVRSLGLPVRQRWDFGSTCTMSIDLAAPPPLAAVAGVPTVRIDRPSARGDEPNGPRRRGPVLQGLSTRQSRRTNPIGRDTGG